MLNVRKNYFCSFQELSNVNLSDLSFYFCIKYIINLQNIVKFVQCTLKNVKRSHTHTHTRTHTHTHHWIKSPSVIAILTKINAEFLDRHHYFNFYIKIQLMCLPLSNYGWLNQGLISYIQKKKILIIFLSFVFIQYVSMVLKCQEKHFQEVWKPTWKQI